MMNVSYSTTNNKTDTLTSRLLEDKEEVIYFRRKLQFLEISGFNIYISFRSASVSASSIQRREETCTTLPRQALQAHPAHHLTMARPLLVITTSPAHHLTMARPGHPIMDLLRRQKLLLGHMATTLRPLHHATTIASDAIMHMELMNKYGYPTYV